MPSVGPGSPPHLTKRKWDGEAHDAPPKRPQSSPPSDNTKSQRIIGPAPPPASLSERPAEAPESDAAPSSDSDSDNFGPSPPQAPGSRSQDADLWLKEALVEETERTEAKKPQREAWMLIPPKGDDWSTRIDPTKLRNRKFNTGKGSKAPTQKGGGGVDTLWTETPEQKRQRLEDEMMGVKKPAQLGGPEDKRDKRKEEEGMEIDRSIREYNKKNRGESLYSEHKKAAPKEKEDDPSARAFDREKDIGGVKIGHAQRKELLNRTKDFGSRFSGGSYL